MRLLMVHVDAFRSEVTERGRSPVVEEPEAPVVDVGEALVVLAAVEKADEDRADRAVDAARVEIGAQARRVGVERIVLNPFAHLFAELAAPSFAVACFARLAEALAADGFAVERIPFGWFNTLEMKAKGHPFSRVARIVPRAARPSS